MAEQAARVIDELADELFRQVLSARPLYATMLGYGEYAADLPDLSPEGEERRRAALTAVRERAARVSPDALDDERRITRDVIGATARDGLLALEARAHDYTVTPIPQTGLAASVLIGFPKTPIRDLADAEAYLVRCRKLPAWLDTALGRLVEGRAAGRTPVRRLAVKAGEQLAGYLATSLADDPLLAVPDPPGPSAAAWRERLTAIVRDEVRPAFAGYREHLLAEVVPHTRPDGLPGLVHLPDGERLYRAFAAQHTTTDLDVEEIHRIGLDLVAGLVEEMAELGAALDTAGFAETQARLRQDPELNFRSEDEVVAAARDALSRAQEASSQVLHALPRAECVVVPMTSHEVGNGDLGHYQWPTRDGTRPGTYWINTYQPRTRPRFEAQTLAFHESVPGHHTQLALSGELADLGELRRHAQATAFSEGWALYVERLADEIGLYTDDIHRFGMISFDLWRACRLVVDTGMHAMGWSRERAVHYLRDHTALTPANVDNEIDRYIGWPGQALGYMIGRLEIRRLRAEAEQALGDRFDLRDFHSELIGHGSLPLPVARDVMTRWVTGRRVAP